MAYSSMIVVMLAALFFGSVVARSQAAAQAPSPAALSNSPAATPVSVPVQSPAPTPVSVPVQSPAPTPAKTTLSPVSTPSPINSPASPPFPHSSAPVYPLSLSPSISTPPSDAPAPAKNDAALNRLSLGSIAVGAFVVAFVA